MQRTHLFELATCVFCRSLTDFEKHQRLMLLLFRVWHELRVEMDPIQARVCVLVGILTYCKPCVALRSALGMKQTLKTC